MHKFHYYRDHIHHKQKNWIEHFRQRNQQYEKWIQHFIQMLQNGKT